MRYLVDEERVAGDALHRLEKEPGEGVASHLWQLLALAQHRLPRATLTAPETQRALCYTTKNPL